jgi:hypothetical protein
MVAAPFIFGLPAVPLTNLAVINSRSSDSLSREFAGLCSRLQAGNEPEVA